MKISKRQLKRIIKEEKQKLVKESVTDMYDLSGMIAQVSINIATEFENAMYQLPVEDPGLVGPTWDSEVDLAGDALEDAIQVAIENTIQRIESQLHNGDFAR